MPNLGGYWPRIRGGAAVARFKFGSYEAVLAKDMESLGAVKYLYVLLVFKIPERTLRICVSSEKRIGGVLFPSLGTQEPSGSHVLGLFPGTGHINLGSSDDWADLDKFTVRALALAREHLQVRDEVVELRIPGRR